MPVASDDLLSGLQRDLCPASVPTYKSEMIFRESSEILKRYTINLGDPLIVNPPPTEEIVSVVRIILQI